MLKKSKNTFVLGHGNNLFLKTTTHFYSPSISSLCSLNCSGIKTIKVLVRKQNNKFCEEIITGQTPDNVQKVYKKCKMSGLKSF